MKKRLPAYLLFFVFFPSSVSKIKSLASQVFTVSTGKFEEGGELEMKNNEKEVDN